MNWPAATFFAMVALALAGFANYWMLLQIRIGISEAISGIKQWANDKFAHREPTEERLRELEERERDIRFKMK